MSLNLYILRGGELPQSSRAWADAAAPMAPFHIWKSEVLTLSAWWFKQPSHGAMSQVSSLEEVPAVVMAKLSLWHRCGETVTGAACMLTEMTREAVKHERIERDTTGLRAALKARMAQ